MKHQNKNIQSNKNEILLGHRQNTTKLFPPIIRRKKENLADYVTITTESGTIEEWYQDM